MSLRTFSKFYYGQNVDETNYTLDFSEGGPELQASVNVGDYTLSTLLAEIKTQLEALGALEYTVTVSRDTRIVTISSTANFELLVNTGTRSGVSVYTLLGFIGADRTGASSYSGNLPSGFVYEPQFILQDHISSDNFQSFIDPSVNVSSAGVVQVVKFGVQYFMQCNIKYATDEAHPAYGPIRNDPNGETNLRSFMQYTTSKNKFEFMENVSDSSIFEIMILESTDGSSDGTGFKLKEMYGEGLPFHYETGTLKFRRVA